MCRMDVAVKKESGPQYDVHFRSYVPKDVSLRSQCLAPVHLPDVVSDIGNRVVESASKAGEGDLASLAPKKAAWDMERDMESKLEQAERKTQQSIAQEVKKRTT